MKRILAAALATGVALSAIAPLASASAAEGCGRGYHRGPHGRCFPNGRGPMVVAPGLVIGNFYKGRGYWDGSRYWQHRERRGNDWRYR